MILVPALWAGDWDTVYIAGPVAAVASVFLWRNLRDPAKTRAQGLRCTVTFTLSDNRDRVVKGTPARVRPRVTSFGAAWDVALDRHPQGGDLSMIDTPQRGWVWLGPDNLPEKVKIDYGSTWKTWGVISAAPAPPPV